MPDSPPGVRSLADDLRARRDEDLTALLLARPDLARPAASDLTALAARSTTRSSTVRAVDGLDLTTLQVLEAAAARGDALTATGLAHLLADLPLDTVATALDDLWTLALLWGPPEDRRLSRGVLEVLGPHPAGLGPRADELDLTAVAGGRGLVTGGGTDLVTVTAALPEPAAAVLSSLAWGPPVAHEPEPGSRAAEGVETLERAGLVARRDGQVILPREVALLVRGGRLHREPAPSAPTLDGTTRSALVVDRVGGGAASELLALVDDLLSAWSTEPPRVLRGGGLSVRDLAAAARTLDLDAHAAAFVLELAHAAGLLAEDQSEDPVWAPTQGYDEWLLRSGSERWAVLASAWWGSTRDPARIGTRRADGKVVNALGHDVHDPAARALRQSVLGVLARTEPGVAPSTDTVLARLRWQRPRRLPTDLAHRVGSVVDQASRLGLVALGALTAAGRALVAREEAPLDRPGRATTAVPAAEPPEASLAAAMAAHLAAPVSRVLLQADLTAVAPGPLTPELSHVLRRLADLESRGGATVHRFSEASIRRGLDAGWGTDEILRRLEEASDTPVPQPLDYLVRDTARRHGQVRITETRTCLRVDDPSSLEALLGSRALGALQLRRVAPTVALSPLAPEVVLEFIQEAGIGAVRENAQGAITVTARPPHRSPAPRVPAAVLRGLTVEDVTQSVSALRSADRVPATEPRSARRGAPLVPTGDPTTSLVLLREASADRRQVWVGYADGAGAVRRFLFQPDTVDNGRVHGVADGVRRTLSVHRITGVAPD